MKTAIEAIIATYENQIGQIDPDKSFTFEIKDLPFDVSINVEFTFITHVIPTQEPEPDEVIWGKESIMFLRSDGVKELARLVWEVCENVADMKIKSETEAESW